MKTLIYALLLVLVFVGAGAYQLNREGLLTRATYDSYFAPSEEEEKRPLINPEPVGLASAINVSKQELRDQAKDIETLNERLEAQRKELDEERASIEKRIEDLKEQERASAERHAEALRDKKNRGGSGASMSDEQARLVKMYGGMPPDDAAALLDKMPDETVASILLQMRNRQAAQIMGALDKDKAAKVGKLLWSGGEAAPVSELAAAP